MYQMLLNFPHTVTVLELNATDRVQNITVFDQTLIASVQNVIVHYPRQLIQSLSGRND